MKSISTLWEINIVNHMKHIALVLLVLLIPLISAAQSERVVNGIVYGEKGGPVVGATVYARGADMSVKTDGEGRFTITIPMSTKELRADCPGYHALALRIDGQFMVFKMKLDKDYASRAYEYASIEAKLAQDAEKKKIDEAKAQAEAARNEKWRVTDSLYNQKYKNKGFVHSVEISYGYQLDQGEVVYKNLGFRNYRSLHPVEVNYTIAYRFNHFLSLGIGTGLQYQIVNLCTYPDVFHPSYTQQEKFTPINIPVFLNVKTYLSRGWCQPLLSISGGVYCPNLEGMIDVGFGVNFRMNRTTNAYLLLGIRTTPYGDFHQYVSNVIEDRPDFFIYHPSVAWTPSFKVGFTF